MEVLVRVEARAAVPAVAAGVGRGDRQQGDQAGHPKGGNLQHKLRAQEMVGGVHGWVVGGWWVGMDVFVCMLYVGLIVCSSS